MQPFVAGHRHVGFIAITKATLMLGADCGSGAIIEATLPCLVQIVALELFFMLLADAPIRAADCGKRAVTNAKLLG